MNITSRPSSVAYDSFSSFKSISKGISLFVAGVGCLVLMGWALDIAALKSVLPGLVSMKSNTALLFVLCGISLWMQVEEKSHRIAQACAFIVAFVGLLTLGEYMFNGDLGIDQVLFRDTAAGVLYPGRMSPATTLCFLLIGSALIFLDNSSRNRFRESLVLATFAISGLALIGYLYGVSSLYQIGAYSSMALHTASSFLLFSLGVLFAQPERGLMQTLLADTAGGNILRRLLPVVLVGPVLLGWVRLWGQRAGLYDTAFGLAIMVISLITTLTIFIWFNARQLNAIDMKRKQVDDSLRASELRFRSTLESMMEGCQIIGYDWRYIYINASAEKQNRRPNQELLGRIYMDMWPGIEATAVYVGLRDCMDQRIPQHIVTEFIFPDGNSGWFELSIQPVPDGIFILSSDITERKQAEQALLEREMKLAILLDILPVGISILDEERKVSYTNPALKKILDISDEGLLKGTYAKRKYLRADGTSMPVDELASTQVFKEKREIDGIETGVVKEDESIIWTDVSAVPVDFADWKVVMVTSDITKRKRAEEDLRVNERRLHLAASAGAVGIWDWDVVKDELIWDESMYALYDIHEKDFSGAYHAWTSTLHPDDRQFTETEIQAALHGEREYAPEFRIVRPDGAVRVIKATSQTIRDQDGKALRMIGTNIDITERKQAEIEILKLNAELEEKVAKRTEELAVANKQLHELSTIDQLTGLYNRRGFLLLAEEQLLLAQRARRNLLIFYADLDGLKQINDRLGHGAGDKAILAAARTLNETFRTSDIKARLGGDEFIVLAMEAKEDCTQALLTRLHAKLAEKDQTMSVGVITFDAKNDTSIDNLIARADEAMYAEKRTKPGRREMGS